VTYRRLVFAAASGVIQSEVRLMKDGSSVDFEHLVMEVHRFIAAACLNQIEEICASDSLSVNRDKNSFRVSEFSSLKSIALIGAGGCSLPMYLYHSQQFINALRSSSSQLIIDAVEPDQRILDIAEKYFGALFVNKSMKRIEIAAADYSFSGENPVSIIAHDTDGVSFFRGKVQDNSSVRKMSPSTNKVIYNVTDFVKDTDVIRRVYDVIIIDAFEDRVAPPKSVLSEMQVLNMLPLFYPHNYPTLRFRHKI